MRRYECYNLCRKYHGQVVRIQDRSDMYHLGRVIDVTEDSVWIEPVQRRRQRGFNGGFGYSPLYDDEFYGYDDYGYNNSWDDDCCFAGAAVELAFGFIVGISIASLFFF
ncbi:hypothetical protein [Ectobacillus panaciterrae]|uniref:hypothetical protein n=1 Tax=Ectobacillus panaciterrae TaxID=363872 RepID=UPI0003FC7DFF|nr:hypothetical protein [Ectobacillus panaciterrae]